MSEMVRNASNRRSKALWSLILLVSCALLVPLFGPAQRALAATASDTFNRANGSLGSNWTAVSDGALTITSQVAAGTSSTAVRGDIWNAASFGSDQYSQIEVTSTQLTGGQWVAAVVRSQNNGQNAYAGLYFWNSGAPVLMVFRRTGGAWTQIGSTYNSGALAAGTQLQLKAAGSTISFLQNGVQRISVTDTALTGGAPGIMAYGTSRADNWAGGDASGAGGTTYSVGGNVSGLSGTVVLQDNGGDSLTATANGPFTFPTSLASGAVYNVTVATNPSGQTCTVSSGSGTVGSANVTNVAVTCAAAPTFSVGGSVSGLSGTVVLQDNGGDSLTVTANGPFTFATKLATGAAYSVTVATNPSGQTCTVASGSGTVGTANITSVSVVCTTSGTTSGATDNFNRANGALGPNWTAVSDGALTITSQVAAGTAGNGTSGDIWTASSFGSDQYSQIEVTSTQLTGGQWVAAVVRSQNNGQNAYAGLYFWNSGAPVLSVFKRTGGAWTQIGSTYSSGALPAGTQLQLKAVGSTISFLQNGVQRISVTDTALTGGAPGIMAYGTSRADNWAGGPATGGGAATFSVGGSVSGLSGTVVLQDNGADSLTLTANGPFTFPTQLAGGAAYSVTVKTNPSGQTCTVSSGSGTIGSANVTNVAVTCSNAATFSVGGTVSGLSGTVVLQDNGAADLSLTANGPFTFATQLPGGAAYSVTVATNPSGLSCTVSNGSGTIGTANVTSVSVVCTTSGTTSGATDNFNRANGALGPNWTATSDGALAITSQVAAGSAGNGMSGDLWTASSFGSDQYSQIEVTSTQLTGGQWVATVVRAQNGGQDAYAGLYFWNSGNPALMLFERSGGGWIQLGSTYSSGALAAGTQLQLKAAGSTISFLQNGVPRISVTDTTLTGGSPGIMAFGTGQVDNWSGGSAIGSGTYSVGGTVSGLSGTVVLQDNGGDSLTLGANGPFTFATKLAGGTNYSVTVRTNPTGQICSVSNGTGTTTTANITNVSVTCTNSSTTSGTTDDFNRADGPLGANWADISDGGLAIASQAVTGTAASSVTGDIRTGESYTSDQYSQIEVTSTQLTGSQWIGPAVRVQSGGQSAYAGIYNWNSGSPNLMLFERNGGAWSQLGSTYNSGALTAGTQIKIMAVGNTVALMVNGVERIAVAATDLSGGAPGVMASGAAKADNWAGGTAGFEVHPLGTDASGVINYDAISANNGPGPQVVRVLKPTNPAAGVPHSFLYVLPVEAGAGNTFGDPMQVLAGMDAQDKYNLTIVEPTFAIEPWYADSATDPNLQYETFITQELVPWVKQNLSTTGTEQNWLIGFSKSGVGGQDLILKHPGLFTLAATWDFPADMSSYDQFTDSAENYGTDANFQANYRLTQSFVDAHKAPFQTSNRIWIGSYALYQQDVADYNTLLTAEGIAHITQTPTNMTHNWTSGWVPIAMAALRQDSINFH
jgi:uncharacterized membrane protein